VAQPVASEDEPGRPPARRRRWTSFVTNDTAPGRIARELHEEANPIHSLGVEHDDHTLIIHLSDSTEAAGPRSPLIERRAAGPLSRAPGRPARLVMLTTTCTSDDPGAPLRVPSDYQRASRLSPSNQVERKASGGHA
jgi:hypothetical protein